MTIIDITLLVMLGGFILAGFWFGLIHMIGAVIGIAVGAVLSSRLYEPVAQFVFGITDWNLNLLRVLSFTLLFILINRIIGLLVHVADKAFSFVSWLPFMKTFNRLFGALLGLIEGTLVLGLLVYVASRFPITAASEMVFRDSLIAKLLITVGNLMEPLLPKALQTIQSIF